jgi:hypothetical protein
MCNPVSFLSGSGPDFYLTPLAYMYNNELLFTKDFWPGFDKMQMQRKNLQNYTSNVQSQFWPGFHKMQIWLKNL